MQLKRRKSLLFAVLVLLVLLFSSLTISHQQLLTIKADSKEMLMYTDPGFSSFRNLLDTGMKGEENLTFSNKFISLISRESFLR